MVIEEDLRLSIMKIHLLQKVRVWETKEQLMYKMGMVILKTEVDQNCGYKMVILKMALILIEERGKIEGVS